MAIYLDRRREEKLAARHPKEIRVVDDKAIHIYPEVSPSGSKLAEALTRLFTVDR